MRGNSVLFVLLPYLTTGIVLRNKGYEDIVVGIERNMQQPEDCGQFLDRIEAAFQNASQFLHQATDSQVFFRNISIILPKSWNNCPRVTQAENGASWNSADFQVTENGLLGNTVWTLQSRGCGGAGEYANLPSSLFTKDTGNLGYMILAEWNKLRYGVFPQTGFEDDPLYPSVYKTKGAVLKTTCQESRCNSSCTFLESAQRTGFEPCQLEGFAPTKHNILCGGLSTREVIFANKDFQNREFVEASPVKFRYIVEARTKFVLALDAGSAMIDRDNWKFVRIAARRFVLYDLPNGSELGLVSFSSKARAETDSLVMLSSDKARESIVARIPDYPDKMSEKCLECAVRETIKLFEANGGTASGNVMLLVTSGTTNLNEINAAVELAKEKNMKISLIAYTDSFEHQNVIPSKTGGILTVVPSKGIGSASHLSMMIRLGDALLSSVQHHLAETEEAGDLPVQVHGAEYQDTATSIVNGTFVLDPTLNRDNLFALYFYSRDNPYIKRLWLTSPTGKTYEGKSEYSMSGHYFTPLHGVDTPGLWSYAFERESQSHQSHFVKVLSRRKNPNQPSITAKLLTGSGDMNLVESPLVLLAEVKFGQYPVHDARVRVQVKYNGSEAREIQLLDSGSGDPDITSGDGIYSRYFIPPVSGPMEFSFTLLVDHNDGRAYTHREGRSDADGQASSVCCGSAIMVYREDRDYLPAFQRIVPSHSLKVTHAPPTGSLPPNRISDLTVKVEPKALVKMEWTAPGSNYDDGRATAYELRYSSFLSDLTHDFEILPAISMIDNPLPAGTKSEFSFTFTHYDTPFYFVLRAIDEGGNKGQLSNPVEVYIPAPPTPPPTTTTAAPLLTNTAPPDSLQLTIGAIAGIAAGGLLAVVLIIISACCAVNKRKAKGKYMKDASLKSAAIYTSGQIKTAALKESDKNISVDTVDSGVRSSVQPVHWTASQLLTEHERRQTPISALKTYPSYQPNPTSDYSYLNDSYVQNGSVYNGYSSNSVPYYPSQEYNYRQEDRYGPYGGGGSPRSGSYSGTSEGLPPPYDSSGEYHGPAKVPPPTLPKPKAAKNSSPNLQGSFTSLASDRKRRNITQV